MKYWVYINDKVTGPFTTDKLVTLNGFTPDTLICSEENANSGNQQWVKASSIFEFEQPAPAAQPAAAPASSAAVGSGDALTAALLAKLDAMNTQLTGLQTKMDGMQTQLTESIATQQQAAQEAAARDEALAKQVDHISAEQRAAKAPIQPTHELTDPSAILNPGGDSRSLELTLPGDLESIDDASSTEDTNDVVLTSALTSLHNAPEQTEEEKESTFQDLLTPVQAEALAKQAEEKTEDADQKAKDDVVSSITDHQAESDAIDQVIKEKEEDEEKKSKTMRWLSAGAAALAGAVGLKKKMESAPAEEKPAEEPAADKPQEEKAPEQEPAPEQKAAPVQEEPEQQPAADIPTLDTPEASETPAEEKAEETQEPAQGEDLPQLDMPDMSNANTEEIALSEPAEAPQPELQQLDEQPAETAEEPAKEEPAAEPEQTAEEPQEPTQPTVQELVPNAPTEAPVDENILTDADLADAFTERKSHDEPSVEQLFGLASAGAAVAAAGAVAAANTDGEPQEQKPAEEQASTEEKSEEKQAEEQPAQLGEGQAPAASEQPQGAAQNPNDLTEIELKEGSTYLISDFVPPAVATAQVEENKEAQPQDSNIAEEIRPAQVLPDGTANPADMTVSQLVLENTIKAKRGASLDIKTVPMVNDPTQSDRLHIEGMDDINAEHDLQSADLEPAGKTARTVVGLIIIAFLGAVTYGMLAFMNWVPEQWNLLSKLQNKPAATQQQDSQLNEMLPSDGLETQTVDENTPLGQSEPYANVLSEIQGYMLPNGKTLKAFVEEKHPQAVDLITWEISTAVDPDNYSVLIKVPPENAQGFKASYRFNYNEITRTLVPTVSDAKNLLDSANEPQQN